MWFFVFFEHAPVAGIIYAGNKMVAEEMDGVVKYYLTDHLGSTRIVTDAAGIKVAEYNYKAYRERESSSGAFSTEYQFTGKLLDTEVGLSYFSARWYDPEVGRFITQDPAKDGLNWYSYCEDNPVKYNDPNGLKPELKTYSSCTSVNGVNICYQSMIISDVGYTYTVSRTVVRNDNPEAHGNLAMQCSITSTLTIKDSAEGGKFANTFNTATGIVDFSVDIATWGVGEGASTLMTRQRS